MAHHTEILYIDCSLPVGITIAEYRAGRPTRPTLWQRLTARGK